MDNINYNFDDGYNLPFSLDAEQSVLGAVLLEPSCIPRALEMLRPEAFHLQQHRVIFSAVQRLFTVGGKIDFVTILEELRRDSDFDETSGRTYLTQLAQLVPSLANLEAYANIVREKYYIRSLILASKEIIGYASDGQEDATTLLDAAEQRIYQIRQGKETTGLKHIKDVIVNEAFDRISKLGSEDSAELLGVPSGIGSLDTVTTGLNKSDLILLAARPSVGKTSLALNMARNVAVNAKRTVAIFSLEMTGEQLVLRLLSSEAQIAGNKFRTGKLTPDEWGRLAGAGEVLSASEIYIDDTSNITVPQMKAKLRRLKDVGLVVIDYLQLMSSGKRNENRVQEVSEITRNLKIMAKELNVPVLTLSQLSRGVESRQGHRPILSDLRDSGSIEQDADIVMFLHRPAMYESERTGDNENKAEILVAKNRHGEIRDVELNWEGQFTRFTAVEERYEEY